VTGAGRARRSVSWAVLLAAAAAGSTSSLLGCGTRPPAIRGTIDERSQAMSLAWRVLSDNAGVDGILAIKSPSEATAGLLREIATTCGEAASRLETIAKASSIPLDATGLPAPEVRVRSAIKGATTRELLFSSGDAFERRVLLTQVEALGYADALLDEVSAQLKAADLSKDAEEVAAYGDRLASLRVKVIDRLAVAAEPAARDAAASGGG